MKLFKTCKDCLIEKPIEEFYANNRWSFSSRCKICHTLYIKKNKQINNKRESIYQNNRNKQHTKELWYNRGYFHKKAKRYAQKKRLYPNFCPYCWSKCKTIIHHPSYKTFNDWSIVTFCCYKCHNKIHQWKISNIIPINLLG